MENDRSRKPQTRSPRGFGGPRVVVVGALIVIAITAFIATRILSTPEGDDPEPTPEFPVNEG